MYSPTIGRFLQTDPIGYADGMHLYAYVGNDPVNGVDPTGLSTITVTRSRQEKKQPTGTSGGTYMGGTPTFGNGYDGDSPGGRLGLDDSAGCQGACDAIAETDGNTITVTGLRIPARYLGSLSGLSFGSLQGDGPCRVPPSPGPGSSVINSNIREARREAAVNDADPFLGPFGILEYVSNLGQVSLKVTRASDQNYKANPLFPGSAAFGNFNFGATMQARGFSLRETLAYSDAFQRLSTLRADPAEDIADVTNGFNYAARGCDSQ